MNNEKRVIKLKPGMATRLEVASDIKVNIGSGTFVLSQDKEGVRLREADYKLKPEDQKKLPYSNPEWSHLTRTAVQLAGIVLKPGERVDLGRQNGVDIIDTEGNVRTDTDALQFGSSLGEFMKADTALSRQHLGVMVMDASHVVLADMESTNGTVVST